MDSNLFLPLERIAGFLILIDKTDMIVPRIHTKNSRGFHCTSVSNLLSRKSTLDGRIGFQNFLESTEWGQLRRSRCWRYMYRCRRIGKLFYYLNFLFLCNVNIFFSIFSPNLNYLLFKNKCNHYVFKNVNMKILL